MMLGMVKVPAPRHTMTNENNTTYADVLRFDEDIRGEGARTRFNNITVPKEGSFYKSEEVTR